jgi:hypothetical protein
MDHSNTNPACQLDVRDAYDFQSRIDYDLCGTKREVVLEFKNFYFLI